MITYLNEYPFHKVMDVYFWFTVEPLVLGTMQVVGIKNMFWMIKKKKTTTKQNL